MESQFNTGQSTAAARARRWLVALCFAVWTLLAAAGAWWLISDASRSADAVIRVDPSEAKAWQLRLRDTIALARLNFPWALAWCFQSPYVVWVGVRFSLGAGRWWHRLPVLLAAGVGFVVISQWLSQRLGGGAALIVMVRQSAESHGGAIAPSPKGVVNLATGGWVTNRFITNQLTEVVVSSEDAGPAANLRWQMRGELLAGALTNLAPLPPGGAAGMLPRPRSLRGSQWSAMLDSLAFVALIGLAHAGVFYRRYREHEQEASLLESRLNEARLHALQAQLQPHFLFNTLNGIATLVRRDPAAAEEMLLSLSDLLRIALSSSQRQEIPLREELEFLDRYLAIQRMRFGERLEVKEQIDPKALECLVPALLLQPLVENAIRHGLEPSGRPGRLGITARRDGDSLRLTVEDNGVGLRAGDQPASGVGLANVRERLAALHGSAQAFSLVPAPQGGVLVSITMLARTSGNLPAKEEALA